MRTGPKPPEANSAAPGERSAHGTAQDGTKEAQRKDASAGDGESGPSRFLIGLEVKLQKKKKKIKKYSFGLKKGAGGIGEKSPSSFYDNQHSKSLHCNRT